MADLNVSTIGVAVERFSPAQVADTSPKAADTLIEQNKDDTSRKEHIKEVLKDVIAVSKDGDTAQASKDSKDKLEETKELGDVKELTNKTKVSDEPSAAKKLFDELKAKQESGPSPAERAKENAEKAKARIEDSKKDKQQNLQKKENVLTQKNSASELSKAAANETKQPAKQSNVRDFAEYTDAQLRQMYIKGDISRYDYDHELSSREETSDIRSAEENSEKVFNEGIVRALKNESKAERSSENIERAFDEEANDNIQAEQRMAMVDAAELTG